MSFGKKEFVPGDESCAGMLGRSSDVGSRIGASISSSYSYVTVESRVLATTL